MEEINETEELDEAIEPLVVTTPALDEKPVALSPVEGGPPEMLYVVEVWKDEPYYVPYRRTDVRWKVQRGDEEHLVLEDRLTEGEARSLRADELLDQYRLDDLMKDEEMIKNAIKDRTERVKRLDEKGRRIVSAMFKRTEEAANGGSYITQKELNALETEYARTMDYATLTPRQEAELRDRLHEQAVKDHEAGEFKKLDDALVHYGLSAEVEVQDD